MSKKKELKDEIWQIWKIYRLSNEAFLYARYLHQPRSLTELEYINRTHFLDLSRHALWRVAAIELCKLFSDSEKQKFNLNKFIGKLKPDGHFKHLNFDYSLLEKWTTQIQGFSDTIEYLKLLRDEIYSHTDRSKTDLSKKEKSFEEMNKLFLLVEEIINRINEFNGENLWSSELDINEFDLIKEYSDNFDRKIKEELSNRLK